MRGERLSTLEASYLCFEHPGRPVHVGAVAVFEGGPLLDARGRLRLDAIRDHVAGRLARLPRLRRRMAPGPLGLDRPHWVDCPAFDVADHVSEVHLEPAGGEDALRRLAEDRHTRPFPAGRPPWEMVFVTGLHGGRVGLVERAHHALVDGIGGVEIAGAVLDLDPTAPVAAPPARPTARGGAGSGLGGLAATVRRVLELPVRAPGAALQSARSAVQGVTTAVREARTLTGAVAALADTGVLAPRTSLTAAPGPRRRLAWTRAGLADVKAAGRAAGATVNDVVLAAVTAGLRALLIARGDPVGPDLVLKALVPVSEHEAGDGADLGNRVSAVLAPLPVGRADPADRLAFVTAAMSGVKARREAAGVHVALRGADLLAMPAVRAAVQGLERQPFVNLVVTNVPGPQAPLYLLGARMLEAFPVVPVVANMSVGVAVLSYDGALTVCLTADADACPDVDVLAAGIERGVAELGVLAPEPQAPQVPEPEPQATRAEPRTPELEGARS